MSNRYVVKFLSIAMLVSLVGCAGAQPMPPSGKHDLEFTAQSTYPIKRVEWIVVDDIDAACRGMSPLMEGRRYVGCTQFNATSCRVYTGRNTTLSVLGHEMRHCFEGHWHK
jgi:hypothetical protein